MEPRRHKSLGSTQQCFTLNYAHDYVDDAATCCQKIAAAWDQFTCPRLIINRGGTLGQVAFLQSSPAVKVPKAAAFGLLPYWLVPCVHVLRIGIRCRRCHSRFEVLADRALGVGLHDRAVVAYPFARPRGLVVLGAALAPYHVLLFCAALLLLLLLLELFERVDKDNDVLDDDFVQGTVGAVGGYVLHAGEDVEPGHDLGEDGVFAVQVRCGFVCDEELAGVCVLALVRHGDCRV